MRYTGGDCMRTAVRYAHTCTHTHSRRAEDGAAASGNRVVIPQYFPGQFITPPKTPCWLNKQVVCSTESVWSSSQSMHVCKADAYLWLERKEENAGVQLVHLQAQLWPAALASSWSMRALFRISVLETVSTALPSLTVVAVTVSEKAASLVIMSALVQACNAVVDCHGDHAKQTMNENQTRAHKRQRQTHANTHSTQASTVC